ncbi:cytochrome P450 [Fusarium mexicanum]|uniref:Cytochrome P450 n=1 Tax=Fusarium mexicanum TaxID=751941 RepID=A0A8H5I7R0_9HYPO|nr:cytochrome P450 [Fusarium mexicanum]
MSSFSINHFKLALIPESRWHSSRFPGPVHMRASVFPYLYKELVGTLSDDILDLHRHYGEVVRVAPHELAFANTKAWDDIYNQKPSFGRDARFYSSADKHLASVDREKGDMVRRALQPGFSERSRRAQEPIIMTHIDLMIRRLHDKCEGGETPLDMVSWYDFTTFDIQSDLAFGETFGCLEASRYHAWVSDTFKLSRAGRLLRLLNYVPRLKRILFLLVGKSAEKQLKEHTKVPRLKLMKLIDGSKEERPDLIRNLIQRKEDLGLSMEELQANAMILVRAGAETTATALSGLTFYLLTNTVALQKVTLEIRSAFKDEHEITFTSTGHLKFLQACINEALRLYPPISIGMPRVTPHAGALICGHYVPGDTTVSVNQWALYHQESLFRDPFNFHPERFFGDPQYASDDLHALQPFLVGPRACFGKFPCRDTHHTRPIVMEF